MTGHSYESGWGRYRSPAADMSMRVSDAERQQVADALSTHYAEGRLDAVEFNERMSQAMSAKTRADLSGLLTDLPNPAPAAAPAQTRVRQRSRLLAMVLLTVVVIAAISALVPPHLGWWHIPWFLVAVVAFIVWRKARFHHHRFHRHGPPATLDQGQYPHRHRHW